MMTDTAIVLTAELEKCKRKLDVAKVALDFYADDMNYLRDVVGTVEVTWHDELDWIPDNGEVAREALQEIEKSNL